MLTFLTISRRTTFTLAGVKLKRERCFHRTMNLFNSKKAHGPIDLISKFVLVIVGVVFIKLAISGVSLPASILLLFGIFLVISQILSFFM